MKTLLAIVEQGGYPDFTSLYKSLGYQVIIATSMRKGLALLKQHHPDTITAEFIYSPMYSARISNLESLFAAIENLQVNPKLIIFIDKEERHHLNKLAIPEGRCHTITYPITNDKLLSNIGETSSIS